MAGARRPPASDKSPMSMNGLLRCQAKLTQPKAGMAACLAMIPSAYNGTSCPATAASNGGSSERSSEGLDSRWALPGAGSFNRPTVREVVSNRTEQKNFKKYNEGRSISGYILRKKKQRGRARAMKKILFVCHGSILRSLEKACYINGFRRSNGAYYTTITPFVKEL